MCPRFIYLFRRLTQTARRVVLDTARELRLSDFRPLDFELDFSKTPDLPPVSVGAGEDSLVLTGVADRVDGWERDGKLYLRVVDYKSGHKTFSLTDVWYGMGLQMLLYLFALEKNGGEHYKKPIVPAGVLYVPARDVLLSAPEKLSDEELLKEKAVMINDDKPLVRVTEGGAVIYGTPWDGKHRLSTNTACPLAAVCILERAKDNHIRQIDRSEALPMLLQQTYRPEGIPALTRMLELTEKLAASVRLYRLGCNMDISAAKLSYEAMRKDE